jgi:hypothetical protein
MKKGVPPKDQEQDKKSTQDTDDEVQEEMKRLKAEDHEALEDLSGKSNENEKV